MDDTPRPSVLQHDLDASPYGWCHWHQDSSDTALAVRSIDQGTGPGKSLYACARCRRQYGLAPLAETDAAMTLRVYRFDADGNQQEVVPRFGYEPDRGRPPRGGFPPCACPRCRTP
ncbi:hypothetical protein NX801_15645 [Streptomyces sp. LP05-1]|uniref:Uncharacterized protein n=1 Tax=Streptomyces pyxinae TaxID=2970734 RepID=A0ABT2CKG2_9ACTN|nr:hypothetical protein [Streptomyces sp. LP05-1]MCS0637069.1 hypothetical protein [Streptomyces sp. LP05-1]